MQIDRSAGGWSVALSVESGQPGNILGGLIVLEQARRTPSIGARCSLEFSILDPQFAP
jgi:hypothetical protein